MTDLTIKNLLLYLLVCAADALAVCLAAALGAGRVPGFGDGGFFEPITPLAIGFLAVVIPSLATWLAANRPKLGREDVSALVSEIGALDAKAILSDALYGRRQDEASAALTIDEINVMADRIYERIAARLRGDRQREALRTRE